MVSSSDMAGNTRFLCKTRCSGSSTAKASALSALRWVLKRMACLPTTHHDCVSSTWVSRTTAGGVSHAKIGHCNTANQAARRSLPREESSRPKNRLFGVVGIVYFKPVAAAVSIRRPESINRHGSPSCLAPVKSTSRRITIEAPPSTGTRACMTKRWAGRLPGIGCQWQSCRCPKLRHRAALRSLRHVQNCLPSVRAVPILAPPMDSPCHFRVRLQ